MLNTCKKQRLYSKLSAGFIVLATLTANATETYSSVLSFEKAIKTAQKNDPWLTGNFHKQRAIESMSSAVSTLPDPKVSIGLANLPTDSFDFSQEGMTQAKIGIAQMFPRGDTLAIKSEQLKIESEAFPFQRQNRESQVAVTVGSLWLDAYRVQESIKLIESNRSLFEQLADVAEASYASGNGKTRQQDIVRAQLELTRLENRLDLLNQQQNRYGGMLSQWLSVFDEDGSTQEAHIDTDFVLHGIKLNDDLPTIGLLKHELVYDETRLKPIKLVEYFSKHPSVTAIEKKISATKTGIKLAKQKYKPEWGVSASYGYRGDDPMGNSRSDLLSVGVTFDLPLFTANRQDEEVKSAISKTEAIKTEKLLLLRRLLGSYSSAKGRLLKLKERQSLYQTQLIPQTTEQAEASLTAYTNDVGDFAEVVRSRIAVLNAEIDELVLNVEEQKLILELNYLFITSLKPTKTINSNNFISNSSHAVISGE